MGYEIEFKLIDIKDINRLVSNLDLSKANGKFKYKRDSYYYVISVNSGRIKIALTNDNYISKMKKDIYIIIFKLVGIPFIIVSLFILAWSNNLVNRIKKIKEKVDNINNENYTPKPIDDRYIDELYILDRAVMNMQRYLKEQEEYKNQMYQNISHDFKTPITVMTSYIEACEDGIESTDENN